MKVLTIVKADVLDVHRIDKDGTLDSFDYPEEGE